MTVGRIGSVGGKAEGKINVKLKDEDMADMLDGRDIDEAVE